MVYRENGPVTAGEGRTLAGILCGQEPENVAGYVAIISLQSGRVTICSDCDTEAIKILLDRALFATIAVEVKTEMEEE
jgi:hypothetical protein